MIQHFHLSTSDERIDDQFDLWHSAMEATIDVSRPRGEGQRPGFSARLDAFDLGATGLISMKMPGQGHVRCWSHVKGAGPDHWVLMVPVRDASGADYRQRPLGFGSLGRPFTGSSSDTKVLGLFIPRDFVAENRAALDGVPETTADVGITRLLTDFLVSLELRLARGEPFELADLNRTVADMVLACLLPRNVDRLRAAEGAIEATLFDQMTVQIRRDVESPDLGWESLGARFGLSRAALYRIFGPVGGVEAVIRRARLEAARRILHGPRRIDIETIAARFGFSDGSSFARAFRREFGYPPSVARENGTREVPMTAGMRPPRDGLDAFFGNLARVADAS